MLEKGSYVPRASQFMRYINGKKDYGKMFKDSTENGMYQMKDMMDPGNLTDIDAMNAIRLVNVNVSLAKRAARTQDPLTLVANTYTSSSSYRSQPTYYVTHPPSVNDFDGDNQSFEYQGDGNTNDLTDNLTTSMMLLAR
ncbi:hypothetical protein Tco_1096969, partial [Tanacetum coccineum]